MPTIIEKLHEEHRNIRRVLAVLDDQVERLARGAHPDFDLLLAIATYFCDYPDRCHHPKEDAIFRQLLAKSPASAVSIGDLAREHRDAHARVRRFRDNLQAIFRDEVVSREKIVGAARSFIDAEREHMKMEEEVFFPTAANALDEQDWRVIEAKLRTMRDPLFDEIVEDGFKVLRTSLLNWHYIETGVSVH
jgi:hemerythrin-like domain-containing protein